jgi:hypothetical protein
MITGDQVNNGSVQVTKRGKGTAHYWRSEFERIYVIAALKQRRAATQREPKASCPIVNWPGREIFAESVDT